MKTLRQITAAVAVMAANAMAFAQDSLKTVHDTVATASKTVVEHTEEHNNNWWWLLLLLLPLLYFVFRKKPVKETYVNRDTKDDRGDNFKKY